MLWQINSLVCRIIADLLIKQEILLDKINRTDGVSHSLMTENR